MARFRNVCFTWNDPEGLLDFDEAKMQYLVYQEEVGATGNYHFQGYCEFKTAMVLNSAKALLGGETVHLERRKGSAAQAAAYAKKLDTRVDGPYEHGEPKVQGQRLDLEGFKNEVFAGKRKRELIDDYTGIIARYPKFYDTLTQMNRPTRTVDLQVSLLFGETGLGKTRFVYDLYADSTELFITPLSNGTMWWDTYDSHRYVLIDDFAGAACHMTLSTLLRLLDRYPVPVPIKGSHVWWLPGKIFVTTNILPRHWFKWENRGEQYKALARRFTTVILFFEGGSVEAPENWWKENAPPEATYGPWEFIAPN